MNGKSIYIVVTIVVAALGLGITAYLAMATGHVTVSTEKISLSQSSYSIKMNASSVYTKNITVSTSSDNVNVEIKVLPGDYSTAKAWGDDFVAFASPSKVKLSKGNNAEITIIHYAEKEGNYLVKVIAES